MINGGGKFALHSGGPSSYSHSSFSLQLTCFDPDCRNPGLHSIIHLVLILLLPAVQDCGVTCPCVGTSSAGHCRGWHTPCLPLHDKSDKHFFLTPAAALYPFLHLSLHLDPSLGKLKISKLRSLHCSTELLLLLARVSVCIKSPVCWTGTLMSSSSVLTNMRAATIILSTFIDISTCPHVWLEVVAIVTWAGVTTFLVVTHLVTASVWLVTLIDICTPSVCTIGVGGEPCPALTRSRAGCVDTQLCVATPTIVYQALINVLTCWVVCPCVTRQTGALITTRQIGTYLGTVSIVISALIIVHTERLIGLIRQVARVTSSMRED